ncbi:MAG: BamA/TamA family outer membrane protein [Nitrospirae bacterium]|nr:BamA/TamA family outer membrane protein [Candidatus Troglogloeales bacterium]
MKYLLRNDKSLLILYLFFPLLVCLPSLSDAEQPQYDITAIYNEKKHTIEGTERITFTNSEETELSEIYLFLYPNLYLEKNPSQNRYLRAYPVAFNPGSIEILSIRDIDGNKLAITDFFGAKTLTEIRLTVPIPPKATYSLLIQFVTRIPERYGVFGYFRDWVTLQGGWHPYLPPLVHGRWDIHGLPPPSQFYVDLAVPKDMDVIASADVILSTDVVTPPAESKSHQKRFLGEAQSTPYFSLSIGRDLIRKEKGVNGIDLVYTYSKRNKRYGEQVFKTAESALSFFLSTEGPLPPTRIQLTHASLYKDIVTAGERLLYVDSRLFKVFPLLKEFHEIRVAKGVFQLLWQERLPWEDPWVIEMMAEITADQYTKQQYPKEIRLKSWLQPISFLPLIDQILYADDPLLRQIYFKKLAPESETIFSFHRPMLPLYPRLKKLIPPERLESVITDYKRRLQRGDKPAFKTLLLDQDEKSGTLSSDNNPLDPPFSRGNPTPSVQRFFEKEFLSTGSVDFGIDKVVRKKVGKEYQTTIDIKKEGLGIEPLEILLYEKDGTKLPLLWNGEENRYKTIVTTLSPINVVELDPEEVTSDTYRGNNRDPVKWKVLLKQFHLDYNLTTQFLDYDIDLQFQPVYSTQNRINLGFAHSEPKDIGSLQYSRVLSNKHVVTTGLSYQSPHAIPGLLPEEDVKTVNLSYSLRYPNIPFAREYMEWLTGQYPQWDITFEINQNLMGNNNDYMINGVFDLHRAFVFSNYHQFQTRLLTGVSTGALLKNNRFFLGGENGLRGYTPLQFEGENINLFSLEYLFPLAYETDINLSGFALTHTLQGVLFSDWGTVGSGSELLNLPEYKSDAGAGIRWFVDFLGVMPMTFDLNVAWPINSLVPEEAKPHFYISGGRLLF